MCNFFGVSRSGYYDFAKRIEQPDRDEPIAKLITDCQQQTNNTYGYRRIKIWLLRETGLVINHKAVLRVMNKYGLNSEIRKPRPLYVRQQAFCKYENKLARNFHADSPNQKWVTDISYIHTKEGVLYLSAIKDLYDNFIVAYDMGTVQDYALVYRTIQKAKREWSQGGASSATGLILHSDQGFQYTSHGYMKLTTEYGILPSMSRAGTPLDNAPAENFFSILKAECINRCKINTLDEARTLINDYLYFYNYQRIQLKTKLTPYEKRCQLA
jgi:transposase InsO family protein